MPPMKIELVLEGSRELVRREQRPTGSCPLSRFKTKAAGVWVTSQDAQSSHQAQGQL